MMERRNTKPAPPSVRIDHVGLCVRDLEAATAFLAAALGAETVADTLPESSPSQAGSTVEASFGLATGAVVSAIRMLGLPNGSRIELIEISAADQREPARGSDLGWQHVAVATGDLPEALDRFVRAGGQLLDAPNAGRGGGGFRYGRAPFGALVEFVAARQDADGPGFGSASS